uniref:Uncharacterized protein n=1 Tax=Rhizophora mucronata TaxID=61149 RepID=A0A2P2QFX3_RHIMU
MFLLRHISFGSLNFPPLTSLALVYFSSFYCFIVGQYWFAHHVDVLLYQFFHMIYNMTC